jgi:hypothetical protein
MVPVLPRFDIAAFISASVIQPTFMRVPSYNRISSSSTLLSVLPDICAWAPHELLPIMPPNAQ